MQNSTFFTQILFIFPSTLESRLFVNFTFRDKEMMPLSYCLLSLYFDFFFFLGEGLGFLQSIPHSNLASLVDSGLLQ